MKKLLVLALLFSPLAQAGDIITMLPNTYKTIGYVTVFCWGWGYKAPRSSRTVQHLDADAFERCSFTTLTYEDQKTTVVVRASALTLDDSQVGGQIQLDNLDPRSDWQKQLDQQNQGITIKIPIFRREF